jgi:hypothetical protein
MAGHTSWKKLRAEILAKPGAEQRYERMKHRLDFSLLVYEARTAWDSLSRSLPAGWGPTKPPSLAWNLE